MNRIRFNTAGIDLGDDNKRMAFQITSQKTSAKINEALSAITEEQKAKYDTIMVFILGHKQTSYTIDKDLSEKFRFQADKNIIDIDSILRDIVLLDIDQLDELYRLFLREFRQVKLN